MRAGDIVEVDFGVPIGAKVLGRRPAVVVTADAVLEHEPRTVHVVPLTSNTGRDLPSEVPVAGPDRASMAQAHLLQAVSVVRIGAVVGHTDAAELAQVRAVIIDLLDLY